MQRQTGACGNQITNERSQLVWFVLGRGLFSSGYADACPLHSRVERAVHADLAGVWAAEFVLREKKLLYVQMRQSSEEGHARRCTQEDYLTLKNSCQPTECEKTRQH